MIRRSKTPARVGTLRAPLPVDFSHQLEEESTLLHIFVDADACPVKQEVYRVARRYALSVTLVANSWMNVPHEPWLALEVVHGDLDAADDWIVEHSSAGDIVITTDILLANRCLALKAWALRPTGKPFTEDNIGNAVAARELMADLRDAGEITGGPNAFTKRDRSRFLQQLDETIHAIRKQQALGALVSPSA